MRNVALAWARHTTCIAPVVAVLALAANVTPPSTNATAGPCKVFPPDHGDLGDCPETLPSGASCQPGCAEGYMPGSPAECANGSLSTVACSPRPCNLSGATGPAHGRLGPPCSSLEVVQTGQTCEPICEANWSASGPSSCLLGVFDPGGCVQCGPGRTFNASLRACQDCPRGSYKVDAGNGPCVPCPLGANTLAVGAMLWSACTCNSFTYHVPRARGAGEPFACVPCPENARVAGEPDGRPREGFSILDCQCLKPYTKKVMNATTQQFERCRAPRPCPLSQWLREANLTGPQEFTLQLGQCRDYVNASGLPSGKSCFLECPDRSAPQVKADLLSAPNREILCEDGTIVQHPPIGTWCSEASWTVPPLVFLVAVTLTAGVAMFNIERRQYVFEQACSRAWANGIPQGQGGLWHSAKCKVA